MKIVAIESILERRLDDLYDTTAVTENLVTRFLSKSADAFSRIYNNMINITLRVFKGFARSELRYYVESNPLMVRKLRGLNYVDIRNVQVPYPEGLKVTYREAYDTINAILGSLDAAAVAREGVLLIKQASENGLTDPEIVDQIQAFTTKYKILKKPNVIRDMKSIFTGQRDAIIELPFQKFFRNMTDYNYVFDGLLLSEKYFHQARIAFESVEKLNAIVDPMITKFENNRDLITKDTAIILYEFLYTIAEQLDLFGAVCAELQRVEHNFVLTTRRLYEHVQ